MQCFLRLKHLHLSSSFSFTIKNIRTTNIKYHLSSSFVHLLYESKSIARISSLQKDIRHFGSTDIIFSRADHLQPHIQKLIDEFYQLESIKFNWKTYCILLHKASQILTTSDLEQLVQKIEPELNRNCYNAIISGLSKKSGVETKEVQNWYDSMIQRGIIPDISTYSYLFDAYSQCGSLVHATELLIFMKKTTRGILKTYIDMCHRHSRVFSNEDQAIEWISNLVKNEVQMNKFPLAKFISYVEEQSGKEISIWLVHKLHNNHHMEFKMNHLVNFLKLYSKRDHFSEVEMKMFCDLAVILNLSGWNYVIKSFLYPRENLNIFEQFVQELKAEKRNIEEKKKKVILYHTIEYYLQRQKCFNILNILSYFKELDDAEECHDIVNVLETLLSFSPSNHISCLKVVSNDLDRNKFGTKTYNKLFGTLEKEEKMVWTLWRQLKSERTILPDRVSFNQLLKMCSRNDRNSIQDAQNLWLDMQKEKIEPDVRSVFSFISCLSKKGCFDECFQLINQVRSDSLDVNVFHQIIDQAGQQEKWVEGWRSYEEMERKKILPNSTTFSFLILCFEKAGEFSRALELLKEMKKKNITLDVNIFNALIKLYTRMDNVPQALVLFQYLKKSTSSQLRPNSDTYLRLLAAHASKGQAIEAKIFYQEHENMFGFSNLTCFNVVLNALVNRKECQQALEWFNSIEDRDFPPDVVSYNTIFKAFCMESNLTFQQLETLYNQMVNMHQINPNQITFTSLLVACDRFPESKARQLEEYILKQIQDLSISMDEKLVDIYLRTSVKERISSSKIQSLIQLIKETNCCSTSNKVKLYNHMFENMHQYDLVQESMDLIRDMELFGPSPDTISLNYTLKTLRNNQQYDAVVELFQRLTKSQMVSPDEETFAETILSLEALEKWKEALELLLLMQKYHQPPTQELIDSSIGNYFFCRHKPSELQSK